MDLLDPSTVPKTYNHPFLSSISTIRDVICWFQQCRDSLSRVMINTNQENPTSRFTMPPDTSLHVLIEKFQQLKWHLVMPSGSQSLRIYGNENLDKTLDSLGLEPSAHLLAVVSCPTELHRQIGTKDSRSSLSSSIIENQNQSSSLIGPNDLSTCTVHIRMINYRNNPLYLQGRVTFTQSYDSHKTTLQRIAVDFSSFCEINMSSFALLHLQTKKMFSYPDDYLRSLYELGLTGDVTLYCHSTLPQQHINGNGSNSNTNQSEQSLLPVIDQFHHQSIDSLTHHHVSSGPVLPFSGIGIPLSGSRVNKTVSQIWADMPQRITTPSSPDLLTKTIKSTAKDLFSMCFQEIYRSLKSYNSHVCRSIKKLPNNLQQILIKNLLEEHLLNPSLMAFFCASGSCLTSLDLSYTIMATNEILKCVSKCSNLQELVLDNEDHVFSNEGLWHLRNCSNLKRLSLNYCAKINDWGIQVVGVLPALCVLAIKYTAVTNVGLKHIYLHFNAENEPSVSPCLRSVDLSGLAISDECLPCIGIFTHLELLNLASTHITNPALFPHLPELRHLDISHCYDLVWEKQIHIKSLSECFPKLTSINVRSTSNSNLVHVTMAMAHCKNLRQIDGIFCHPQITASLVASLSHLPLQTIILTNCRHVTDLWLPVLARFSSTLTHLVLSSCPSITGENNCLVNHLSRLRNLSWLDLSHLENVNANQIFKLVIGNYFPKLQVLWISLTEDEEIEFRFLAKNLHFKVNITKSFVNPLHIDVPLNNT